MQVRGDEATPSIAENESIESPFLHLKQSSKAGNNTMSNNKMISSQNKSNNISPSIINKPIVSFKIQPQPTSNKQRVK